MQRPLLILIHGTFVEHASTRGNDWWQNGSPTTDRFKAETGYDTPEDAEVYTWVGTNSERARRISALRFVARLEELERQGRDYHIVTHSHGGSVAWEALREHIRRCRVDPHRGIDRDLPHMRGLTTVGAPFMHYRSRSDLLATPGIASTMLGLYLGFAIVTLTILGLSIGALLFGSDSVNWMYDIGLDRRNRAILLTLGPPIGALITGGLLFGAGLTSEARQVARDKDLNRRAIRRFGPRLKHIWNELDEAIHGIESTIHTALEIIPEVRISKTSYVADQLALFNTPIKRMAIGPINAMIRPVLNAFIARQIRRALQGADRPFSQLEKVTPGPDQDVVPLPLPEHIARDLAQDADIAAMAIPPAIRRDLTRIAANPTSVMQFLTEIAQEFSNKALIHTGYFDNDLVLGVVIQHIIACRPEGIEPAKPKTENSGETSVSDAERA